MFSVVKLSAAKVSIALSRAWKLVTVPVKMSTDDWSEAVDSFSRAEMSSLSEARYLLSSATS